MDLRAVRSRLQADLDRLRSTAGYLKAGMPRYATLFGRDSLISAWQTLSLDPSIAAATLRTLASFQGRTTEVRSEEEPGKILHEHRFDHSGQVELPDWDFPYYGSIDSTPLFLIVADAYVADTGDFAILDELRDALYLAYKWMIEFGDRDGDGLLEYERRNPSGLFHQGWKDGSQDHLGIRPPVAMVEVQGYAIAAHRAFARFARHFGDDFRANKAEALAEEALRSLNRFFWLPEKRFFALALDGSKTPRSAVTSNPGHLLLTDAVPVDRVDPLVARLFAADLWTPYGIRNHASSEPDFDAYGYHTGTVWPHDNWFIYRGLLAKGRTPEALKVRDALLRAWEELGKIPELYAVVGEALVDLCSNVGRIRANPLQAWSSAGLLDILSRSG